MNFATTKERIIQYIDYKGITIKEFLSITDIKRGFLDSDKLKASVSDVFITKIIANYPDINLNWLLTGKGEMLIKQSNTETATDSEKGAEVDHYINYNRMPAIITVSEEDSGRENIVIVPSKLAAGYVGGGYANDNFIEELPTFRLPFLNHGTFRCFGIEGYSMENGIRDNDFFVGRFLDNIREFGEGKIHALIIPELDSFLLKRVFRHPTDSDMLILRSDNNDIVNTYPDIHIHIRYIAEMWSYASVISFKEPYYNMEKFREILTTNPQKVIYN
ncbi:S24 family peptidase [Elizabethkingia miricola]|uniref:S24 family peptidase n=1 Tax=Elizabethkingia miricola TaxID=172045 RepID=UPI000B352F6F|nr:S24 family peptidase [Elizabethkingia miricola]